MNTERHHRHGSGLPRPDRGAGTRRSQQHEECDRGKPADRPRDQESGARSGRRAGSGRWHQLAGVMGVHRGWGSSLLLRRRPSHAHRRWTLVQGLHQGARLWRRLRRVLVRQPPFQCRVHRKRARPVALAIEQRDQSGNAGLIRRLQVHGMSGPSQCLTRIARFFRAA